MSFEINNAMSVGIGDRVKISQDPKLPAYLNGVTGTVMPFKGQNENPGYRAVLLDWAVNGSNKYLLDVDDCDLIPKSRNLVISRSKIAKSRKNSVFNQFNGKCFYCGIAVLKYEESSESEGDIVFNVDHKTPLIQGGTNKKDNLVCSCRKCNLSKGRLTVEEFRAKKQKENDPESSALIFLKKALEASPDLFFKDSIKAQIKLIEDRACIPLVFAGEVKNEHP